MHRFWGHLFDLTNITSGTSNFDLTPKSRWIIKNVAEIVIVG
jgi:hypothetical protein